MVACPRRGSPCTLSERLGGRLVGDGTAPPAPAAGAGRGTPGGRCLVTPAQQVAIAVPTGALHDGALSLLARSGLASLGAEELGRQLLVEREGLRVILVRPSDVPAYVDHGAADLGIVGKDILWETPGSHYELVDLRFGGCRLVLAVPDASSLDGPETWPPMIRVATKYPRTAAAWFESRGQAAGVVELHGTVGVGPPVGLGAGIVDPPRAGAQPR